MKMFAIDMEEPTDATEEIEVTKITGHLFKTIGKSELHISTPKGTVCIEMGEQDVWNLATELNRMTCLLDLGKTTQLDSGNTGHRRANAK